MRSLLEAFDNNFFLRDMMNAPSKSIMGNTFSTSFTNHSNEEEQKETPVDSELNALGFSRPGTAISMGMENPLERPDSRWGKSVKIKPTELLDYTRKLKADKKSMWFLKVEVLQKEVSYAQKVIDNIEYMVQAIESLSEQA